MFKPTKKQIEEFAKLAVEVGVNVQKGQPLEIRATIDAVEIVRECVKVAYQRGCSYVDVRYMDDVVDRLDYEYQDVKTLSIVPEWSIEKVKFNINNGYCRLMIMGSDPDLLKGIDPVKIQKSSIARMKAMKPYQYYSMNNIGQWSILAYPNLAWAHKVFPEEKDDDKAMEKLWKAILKTSRIEPGKTVENWKKHNEEVKIHAKKLNEYKFKSLHFTNSLGTDLTVGLIKNHIWEGGCDKASNGAIFNPNMPTEEVFTSPQYGKAEGKLVASKPLSYMGKLIEDFSITFKDGKVIKVEARKNQDALEHMVKMDEGASMLGEVALVPYTSPINQTGILFYETLFDENACCHFALGAGFGECIEGGSSMTPEQLKEKGINDSMIHVDFMIGTSDLSIIGTTKDNKKVQIFKDGVWAI